MCSIRLVSFYSAVQRLDKFWKRIQGGRWIVLSKMLYYINIKYAI